MKSIVFWTVSTESMKRALCSLRRSETRVWLSGIKHQVRNVRKPAFKPSWGWMDGNSNKYIYPHPVDSKKLGCFVLVFFYPAITFNQFYLILTSSNHDFIYRV